MDEVDLRPATAVDRDFLYRLRRATLKDYVEQTWGWDEDWQVQHFQQHFDPAACQMIRFREEDIGVVSVMVREDSLFLSNIAILPAYQGRGIGTRIIRQVLNEAGQQDRAVTLQVLKVNPARALYERLGFVVTGENATHYLMRAAPGDQHCAAPGT